MKHYFLKKTVCYALIISMLCTISIYPYDQAFRNQIVSSNINTFTSFEASSPPLDSPPSSALLSDLIRSLLAPRTLKLKNLTPKDKRTLIFEQIESCINLDDTVIDQFFADKLNLIHGHTNPHDHLMTRLTTDTEGTPLLKTEMGAKRFIEILSQPTTNIKEISRRQTIIKELVQNSRLRNQCNELLDTIHQSETYFFELYSKQGLDKSEYNLFKLQPFFTKLGWHKIYSLTLSTRFLQILQAFGIVSLLMIAFGSTTDLTKKIRAYREALAHNPSTFGDELIKFGEQNFFEQSATLRTYTSEALFIITTPFQTLLGLSALKDHVDEILNIQEILIGFTRYLRALRTLFHLFDANPTIKSVMPDVTILMQELVHKKNASDDFNKLNNILTRKPFNRNAPSAFSSPGPLLTAYECLAQPSIRKEYSAVLNMLGEIDVYVALANKMNTHAHYPTTCAQFCFVNLHNTTAKPHLEATNFWNPFIDYKKVICNTIHLNSNQERNVILTGTNTGGKSTLLKALVILVLLALTFGIAPAESLTMTPFSKCIIDMNITDDIGAGLSLFKAEVERAHEILKILKALPKDEYAFIIIDEIFRGTSHDKGEKLALNFMRHLTTFKNCIFITATHFEQLVALEKATEGEIKNYHMGVTLDDKGNVDTYTHKLEPGPSPIVNAEQIAEELSLDFVRSPRIHCY